MCSFGMVVENRRLLDDLDPPIENTSAAVLNLDHSRATQSSTGHLTECTDQLVAHYLQTKTDATGAAERTTDLWCATCEIANMLYIHLGRNDERRLQ